MITLLQKISLLLLVILSLSACQSSTDYLFIVSERGVIKFDDKDEYRQPDFDDSDWDTRGEVVGKGIFWVRLHCDLTEEMDQYKHKGVMITASGNYEAYWDGTYIGSNGALGTPTKPEIPGAYQRYFLLPDSLNTIGHHVMALRMTKENSQPNIHAYFLIQDYFTLLREPLQVSKYMFLLAGAFLIVAIYLFFVFIQQPKEYSVLVLSVTCLVFMALLLMEYLKLFYPYPYPFQLTRLEIIGYCHILGCMLIPLYFMIQFDFPWKKAGLVVVMICLTWVYVNHGKEFDYSARRYNDLTWIFATTIVLYGLVKRRKGAWIVMGSIIASYAIFFGMPYFTFLYVSPFNISIFIGFIFIIISMLYLMAVRRKEERLAYEESLLVSERLKNELLKKNIKPHFIMNTLTSLIDWVEESPKDGVAFINELAKEFEVLSEVADYKLVPIRQEIKLCQSHLRVMGFRKEISYVWQEEGIDPNEIIPPAVLHTAVENGVTHSLPDENRKITFLLRFRRGKDYKEYALHTIALNRASSNQHSQIEGTGLKYIKSRLQESYGDRWKLTSEETAEGWLTRIKIWED